MSYKNNRSREFYGKIFYRIINIKDNKRVVTPLVKYFQFNKRKITEPPGTLIYVGEEKTEKVGITVFTFDETNYQERKVDDLNEIVIEKDNPTITWINIDGIHDTKIIEAIGNKFNLHPLILEDIMNSEQRIKGEELEDSIFLVLKMIYYRPNTKNIAIEQISIIFGSNFVISFQECPGDIFDLIRDRIRTGKGRFRKAGADFLAYSLIDTIVDNYFIILESFGDRIEEIENDLITNPVPETLQIIQTLKREIIILRKSVSPLREVINNLERAESELINKSTKIYLRDVYDHIVNVIDTEELFRDLISGNLDIYLSSLSRKMNEIMKVLTIIATIFIPLTFISGVYGMNFSHMPELDWTWGYPLILLVMGGVGIVMLIYFWRKKWM